MSHASLSSRSLPLTLALPPAPSLADHTSGSSSGDSCLFISNRCVPIVATPIPSPFVLRVDSPANAHRLIRTVTITGVVVDCEPLRSASELTVRGIYRDAAGEFVVGVLPRGVISMSVGGDPRSLQGYCGNRVQNQRVGFRAELNTLRLPEGTQTLRFFFHFPNRPLGSGGNASTVLDITVDNLPS